MAKTPIVKISFIGDSTSAQKSVKDLASVSGEAQVKVEGFGKAFAKLGAELGVALLVKEAAQGVADYTKKIQESSAQILGVTKSQAALNQAFAFAEQQQKALLAPYSDTVAAIADLTPVAQRANLGVTDLYKTVQLLSTLNSGPTGGVEGSVVAINEALAGQYRSLQQRFNLPISGIEAAVGKGVPVLQAINDALAKEGVTMDLVAAKSKTAANQQKIFFDSLAKLGADSGGKQGLDLYTTALVGLNKALQSGAVKEFASGLRDLLQVFISGNAFSDAAITMRKELYLLLYAFNDLVEGVSFGKLSLAKPLADMRAGIVADEGKLRKTIQDSVAGPVADGLSGKGGPLAPAAVAGYGKDIVANYIKGLSSGDLDEVQKIAGQFGDLFKDAAGKDDPARLSNAYVVLSRALHELASQGQLTDDTMRDLSGAFGLQTPEVYTLIAAYTQYQHALSGVALAQVKVQGATAATTVVTELAAGETKRLETALTLATNAANANAAASALVVGRLEQTLKGVQDTAEEAARAGQHQLDGLQADLDGLQRTASQHAAARQAEIAAAQAQLSAASQQRTNDQALLNAAISGELEYEEQILDGLTAEQRARAAVWQAEIDGQRRAKEGANQKVTDLSRAAHKEDRDALHEIDDLRRGGHEKEARAAERALAAKQKQRAAALTLAQADAAVANDEFDAAQDKVKKEGQQQDIKDAQAEKAAQANLTRIQAAADAQKAADDAAIAAKNDQIKKVQEAQKAEAERYAAQERGIQKEIDKTTEAAKVQAAKDKQTITDAQNILNQRKAYWDQEITKATEGATQAGNQALSAKNFADRMNDAFDYAEKISKLDFGNISNAAKALAGVQPGQTTTSPYDETPPYVPPGAGTATPPVAPSNLPQLLEGRPGFPPPSGYHTETDTTGTFWYVPNGHTLKDYGKTPASSAPGDSTISSAKAGLGGPGLQFQRAAGFGGGVAGGSTINIHLPNVTSLGDPAQRATMWRQIEREWDDVERGGHVKSDTGA